MSGAVGMGNPARATGAGAAIGAIASVTVKRTLRGAMLWLGAALAALPIALAALETNLGGHDPDPTIEAVRMVGIQSHAFTMSTVVLGLVVSLLVAWPVGQDLEDRTAVYVWARPLPRWTVLVGKLVVLGPVVAALFAASWIAVTFVAAVPGAAFATASLAAIVAAAAVSSIAAGALALLLPKHPLVIALLVLALLDQVLGAMSGGISNVTVSYHAKVIGGFEDSGSAWSSAIWLAGLAAVWLYVGLRRIARTEA